MRYARAGYQAGFTLAETLVALFILALVSAAGTALLIGATGSAQQIRQAERGARQMDMAQALIRQDIAALSPRVALPDTGYGLAGNLFGGPPRGTDPFLRFVRNGWLNPALLANRSDLQLVRYRLEAGQIIREAVVRPDASQATPVARRILFDNVAEVQLAFWRDGERFLEWAGDADQPVFILPDLIDIEVRFDTGESLYLSVLTGGRS